MFVQVVETTLKYLNNTQAPKILYKFFSLVNSRYWSFTTYISYIPLYNPSSSFLWKILDTDPLQPIYYIYPFITLLGFNIHRGIKLTLSHQDSKCWEFRVVWRLSSSFQRSWSVFTKYCCVANIDQVVRGKYRCKSV